MALRKVQLGKLDLNSEAHRPKLTLAAMYLEEKLNAGVVIEIPSLGISISKDSKAIQEESLTSAYTRTK